MDGRLYRFLIRSGIGILKSSAAEPVFIVSAGRSGSTYLRKLLVASNKINIPPESGGILPNCFESYLLNFTKKRRVEGIIDCFVENPDFSYWNLKKRDIHHYLLDKKNESLGDIISNVYKAYGAIKGGFSSEPWGDKTPYLIYFLRELKIIFPNARFVHVVRNPLHVINSRMIHFNESIKKATMRWKSSVDSVKKIHEDSKLMEIRYEDFVNFDEQLQKVYDFLNLGKFDPAYRKKTIDLGDNKLAHHARINDPSIKTSFELNVNEVEWIKNTLKKEMTFYNY